MRAFWKIAVTACAVAATLGAAIAWRAYKTEAEARKIEQDLAAVRVRADQGDAKAEYKLGNSYYYGRGVPQDFAEALLWYRKAADQGDPKAEYAIGYMYDGGRGVEQDFAESFSWYQKSANQGDRQAECSLGVLYYYGRGVQRDYTQAAFWYRRAAERGLPSAEYDLGYLYEHGQGVPRDRAQALVWLRKAAEQGDEHARRSFGMGLTPTLVVLLALQVLGGAFLVVSELPLSLNIWEPNERSGRPRDWMSIGVGSLCLLTACLSWYGYKRNLIWCWIYGFTGFALLKWTLDAVLLTLVIVFLLKARKSAKADRQLMPDGS